MPLCSFEINIDVQIEYILSFRIPYFLIYLITVGNIGKLWSFLTFLVDMLIGQANNIPEICFTPCSCLRTSSIIIFLNSMSCSLSWLRSIVQSIVWILSHLLMDIFPISFTGIPSSLLKHHSGRGGACLHGWQHPLQLQDQLQAQLHLRGVASRRPPGRSHRPRPAQQSPRGTCSLHSWNLRSVIVIFVKISVTLPR